MSELITKRDDPSLLYAADIADWGQVVSNGGPPCFHLDPEDGKFCLRAKRWAGHDLHHRFVSLRDMLAELEQRAAEDTRRLDALAMMLLDDWIIEGTRWDTENKKPMFHIYSENEKALNGPYWHGDNFREVLDRFMRKDAK